MVQIQHPEIDWIERTGYPSYNQPKEIYCGECGKDITDSEVYCDETYDHLCKRCLLWLHKADY